MRRMFSEKQIEKMIEEGSLSPEEIQEMLVGKFVRIMEAPKSATLTEDQVEQITKGVFIEGDFLGYTNPVLFPAMKAGLNYFGMYIGAGSYNNQKFGIYQIINGVISVGTDRAYISLANTRDINGLLIPSNPASSGTFTLKCVNGTLTWVED